MSCERMLEWRRENSERAEEQNAAEKAHRQAQFAQVEANYRKAQERETKRQKVRYEKEESGVGFSVEQLKNNRARALLASALPGEERIGLTNSVNSVHSEDNDHHAAKMLTTCYHPVANALQNGQRGCGLGDLGDLGKTGSSSDHDLGGLIWVIWVVWVVWSG